MKESKYNFIFKDGEDNILYNSLTGAIAQINDKERKLIERRMFSDLEDIDDYIKEGFFINDEIDEVELIRHNMLCSKFNTDKLSIIIAPTMGCNFNCSYCFENDIRSNAIINDKVIKSIYDFVDSKINTISELNITWYGGEPLLQINKIVEMSEFFLKLCHENNVLYYSTMITNGFLLNDENSIKLRRCNINTIQITLDGNEKTHDMQRRLKPNRPTYKKIIANIKENIDNLPNISIRINMTKNNIDSFYDIVDEIGNFDKKISIYLAKVEDYNCTCNEDTYLTNEEFLEEKIKFIQYYKNSDIDNMYPKETPYYCSAQSINSVVIDSEGYLYKCFVDIGYIKRSYGNILNISKIDIKNMLNYLKFDPTYDEVCKNCKYLPLCMGGCPYKRNINKQENCIYFKGYIDKLLINLINIEINRKKVI
ncbi:radical SAM domain protein [Finegoldia magna ACS-171-V-Col3]|uniref:Radical SAM protein n=1 Tax=Finegoldia dalianensis TaxID=3145239 RepID=A0ABW9KDF7_9FIRM|nr:radical SAM protein [Finegoldia magna]EFK94562.1 radical SAM domain protein [Finegoldia magna ACS-171-V-Col3]